MNSFLSIALRLTLIMSVFASAYSAAAAESESKAEKKSSSKSQSGSLELKEHKVTLHIDLKESHSRLFKIRNKIFRTAVGDPGVAEPVVVSDSEFLLLGKSPGYTTLHVWDNKEGIVGINIRVLKSKSIKAEIASLSNFYRRLLRFGNSNREFPAFKSDIKLEEIELANPAEFYKKKFNSYGLQNSTDNSTKARKTDNSYPDNFPKENSLESGAELAKKEGLQFDPENSIEALSFGKQILFYEYGKFEYPHKRALNIGVSESRVFKIRGKVVKTRTDNPNLAEPIMVSPQEVVILGKAPGSCKLGIEDRNGNNVEIELNIKLKKFYGFLLRSPKEDPVSPSMEETASLLERKKLKVLNFHVSEPKLFKIKNKIARFSISNPDCMTPLIVSPSEIYFEGISRGETSVFIWDTNGNAEGFIIRVKGNPSKENSSPATSQFVAKDREDKNKNCSYIEHHEVEYWTGSSKDIQSFEERIVVKDIASLGRNASLKYNNIGVIALNERNYAKAIFFLKRAIIADPSNKLAQKHLAIAYNNYGLHLQKLPYEAMKQLHMALSLDPKNKTTRGNLEGIIRHMGLSPKSFDDRVALGDTSVENGNTAGAIFEYREALKIKEDSNVRERLESIVNKNSQNLNAIEK